MTGVITIALMLTDDAGQSLTSAHAPGCFRESPNQDSVTHPKQPRRLVGGILTGL